MSAAPAQGPFPPQPQGPFPPQPAAGGRSASQAFFQAIASIPPMQNAPKKQPRYPRGQVITMIVASIVTVLAAFGGALLLLLSK